MALLLVLKSINDYLCQKNPANVTGFKYLFKISLTLNMDICNLSEKQKFP